MPIGDPQRRTLLDFHIAMQHTAVALSSRPNDTIGWSVELDQQERALATQGFEIPTEFREFAEKSVDQARNAFGNFFNSALKTSEQIQASSSAVQSTVHAAVLKSFDHAQANANATFDYAARIAKAKDLREAFEIQSEFVKSLFAAFQAQVKDYGAIAQKAA